ncbi:hypothetical protein FQ775_19135 [Nitratireductor mangrovi]|uniref:DUF4870 domain-containing protein n=1 Tax=Nitratireductor mangrovi TaxID=2599600 RepID=A0A5B8L3H1_9HYPH|nr:DUF4870 domain-containing protein [Nitratireductor mangrovi]QDZ02322.1 hypothetical protein FQ775_19135 [Nitratireductor mangrovi]
MSDMNSGPSEPRQTDRWLDPGKTNIQIIYILYLVSLAIGLTALIGIVIAYMNRGKAGGWVETHYTWAIRTFWIGLLYGLVSALLMVVGIGFLLMIAVAIWAIVRIVIGLQKVSRDEPIGNPESWLI